MVQIEIVKLYFSLVNYILGNLNLFVQINVFCINIIWWHVSEESYIKTFFILGRRGEEVATNAIAERNWNQASSRLRYD